MKINTSNPRIAFIALVLLIGLLPMSLNAQPAAPQKVVPPKTEDYTYSWWAHGWRGKSPEGRKVWNVQTNSYGFALDVEKVEILHLGPIEEAEDYLSAGSADNSAVFNLPKPEFSIVVESGTGTYRCARANPDAIPGNATAAWEGDKPDPKASSTNGFPLRLIDGGRFVQRVDLMHIEFEDDKGGKLPALGRLEIIAWPDCLSLVLDVTAEADLPNLKVVMNLQEGGNVVEEEIALDARKTGTGIRAVLVWAPGATPMDSPLEVTAEEVRKKTKPLNVEYQVGGAQHRIPMRSYGRPPAEKPDHIDRFNLTVANPTDKEQVVRLFFDFDGPTVPPITGLSPILVDANGKPSGVPVQISKNWHQREGMTFLYQGPWFHGYTMLRLAPGETWKGGLVIASAHWGGVAAASHAQLSLIGWGTNQWWDQVAIGSWGESICYDPDVNLNRSMIDDVRPLMVWAMRKEPETKWAWTNNVGGGDFLVYHDDQGEKQFLTRVKSTYLRYCPNLTEVVYSGVSADGHIAASIEVSSPRCDDINRAFHKVRYDVLAPTKFSRLAFYQVGADGYNNHQFEKLARGNREGLLDEWSFEKGGKKYDRQGVACDGDGPWWFSLHEAIPAEFRGQPVLGAWANRGMVIRSWKARLGGKDIPQPYASFFGTQDGGVPSMNVELAPPPDLTELLPGDFVEADLELVILPMSAEEYYGPNENLRAALAASANTWKPVHREALGNALEVMATRGTVKRDYPLVIQVDGEQKAEFSVTGGVGYVPITFTHLDQHTGYDLMCDRGEGWKKIDQTVHGNDYWQTDFNPATGLWERTLNVPLDTPGDERKTVKFTLGKG